MWQHNPWKTGCLRFYNMIWRKLTIYSGVLAVLMACIICGADLVWAGTEVLTEAHTVLSPKPRPLLLLALGFMGLVLFRRI